MFSAWATATLDGNILTFNVESGEETYSSTLTSTIEGIVKTGAGTIILTASSTGFTSGKPITISGGAIEIQNANALGSVNPETGGKALALRYRIKDNYSRFYLRYVEPHREAIQKGVYFAPPLAEFPEWDTVMGLQFENLMLNHLSEFYERLGLDRARVLSIAPYRRAASVRNGPGVQIDLLVQTPKTYFVVEVKRKRRIGVEIEKEVEEKVSRLRVRKGVSVRTALVYQGELDPQVKEDGYFSALIDAESLLGQLRVPQA